MFGEWRGVAGGALLVCDASQWRIRATLDSRAAGAAAADFAGYERAVISPHGDVVAARPVFSGRPNLDLWNVASKQFRLIDKSWPAHDIGFLPDGTFAFTGDLDEPIQFADPATGRRVSPFGEKQ